MALVAAAAAAENFLQSVASYAAVEVAVDLVSTPAAGVRFPGISNGILDMTLFSIILQAALLVYAIYLQKLFWCLAMRQWCV